MVGRYYLTKIIHTLQDITQNNLSDFRKQNEVNSYLIFAHYLRTYTVFR